MKTRFKTLQPFFLASLLALATLPAIADTILFDNTNHSPTYSVNAFTITVPFSVADSFTLTQASTIDDITFVTWTRNGDTVRSVNWEISSFPFECPCFASGVASGLPNTLIELNPYGYDVLQQSFNASDGFEGVTLPSGTYYLQLVDAFSAEGNPVYWDQSDGPANAEQETLEQTIFSIPRSESFQIDGVAGILVPPPPNVPEGSSFSFLLLGGLAFCGSAFFRSRRSRKSAKLLQRFSEPLSLEGEPILALPRLRP